MGKLKPNLNRHGLTPLWENQSLHDLFFFSGYNACIFSKPVNCYWLVCMHARESNCYLLAFQAVLRKPCRRWLSLGAIAECSALFESGRKGFEFKFISY